MDISNLPGVTNAQLIQGLNIVLEEAKFSQNVRGDFSARYDYYCKWAMDSVRTLSSLIAQDDVAALITTTRHWSLVERTVVHGNETVGVLYLLNTELSQRIQEIERMIQFVQNSINQWQRYEGRLIVPDSNIFLHEENQFDEIDWRSRLLVPRREDVHLILPALVIRELDVKKRFGRGNPVSSTNPMEVRTRARLTLRKLNEVLPSPDSHYYLSQTTASGLGFISLTLLLDDINHIRLSDPDSEILDRALALKQTTGKEVTILTRDTSMSFSARNLGLKCILLTDQGD